MLAIGIHLGYFSIRIGHCFQSHSTGTLKFIPVTRSSYGIEEWWPIYRGALPNAYDPESGNIGYDALKQPGLDRCARLDQLFFQYLLQGKDKALDAWNGLIKILRIEYIRQNEPISLGLYLEDGNLAPPPNPRMPWLSGPDRTDELKEKLLELCRPYQITQVLILKERQAIEYYVANNTCFEYGDILALIDGERTSFWLIEEQRLGKIMPLTSAPGLQDLMKTISISHSKSLIEYVSCFHRQDCVEQWPNADELNSWIQKRLKPALSLAWNEIRDPKIRKASKRLFLGGEGAFLIPTGKSKEKGAVSVLENPWYIQAYSAAAIALGSNKVND